MKLEDIDVDSLDPRVHGNGFIQADLYKNTRLHFWGHPEIPRQKVSSPIHDHIFGFKSTVLLGRVVNVMWQPVRCIAKRHGTFHMCEAQAPLPGSHDSKLAKMRHNDTWRIMHVRTESVMCGHDYRILPYHFHETFVTEPTVTYIRKEGLTLKDNPGSTRLPRVLVPKDKEPDNEFDRHAYDRDFLLRIIREVMAS